MISSANQITVTCPQCQHKFSVDDALVPQIAEAKAELRQKMLDWQKDQEEKLRKELVSQNEQEIKLLKEQNEKQKQDLDKAREFELELRKKARALEDKEKNLELEKQRQIDEERKKIQEKTEAELQEKFHLKEKEYEQNMEAMKKSLEEAQRKASQGSQQLQGEILELALENILKQEFPIDEIIPVPKGVSGADVLQKVKDTSGRDCGVIIWESKRTKTWAEDWIQKLKDDQRSVKADIAIIVSSVLPTGVKNFETRDGVHVASFDAFISLAKLVRSGLVELHKTKQSMVGKSNKMEVLYAYLAGNEFRQRFEAIIEAFTGMKGDLDKEKQLYTRVWAKREKQIQKVVDNTVGMYGDLQGLMGASLPEIKLLEPEEQDLLESPEE